MAPGARPRGRPLLASTEYLLRAIETVRANKQRYAEAEARARARRPNRPHFFEFAEGMGGMTAYTAVGMESALMSVPAFGVVDHVDPD